MIMRGEGCYDIKWNCSVWQTIVLESY